MSAERRAGDGFDMADLTSPLLPRYWLKFSSAELTAEDDELLFPSASFLKSIDEQNKIVHFTWLEEDMELSYAHD
jgi:hypothetical protein